MMETGRGEAGREGGNQGGAGRIRSLRGGTVDQGGAGSSGDQGGSGGSVAMPWEFGSATMARKV